MASVHGERLALGPLRDGDIQRIAEVLLRGLSRRSEPIEAHETATLAGASNPSHPGSEDLVSAVSATSSTGAMTQSNT